MNITFAPNETVNAELSCYHRYVTGSGDDREVHRDIQWKEDIEVDMARVTKVATGQTAIPIKVYIPRGCKQATPGGGSNRIEWELTTQAELAGIDLASSFIIPIFVTDESTDTAPLNEHGERVDEIIKPYTSTIAVRENTDGSFSLYAPPRRNPSMMFGLTLFLLIWSIVVGFIFVADDVPILFPIVFGGFELLIVWGTFLVWFGKSWLDVSKNEITITKKLFGLGKPKSINPTSIQDVEPHIGMVVGNTPYYAIRLKTSDRGGRDTIGGLKSKDEAEDLCRRIREAIEL